MYKEHNFRDIKKAKKKQSQIKSLYGYTPQIFQTKGKKKYTIVQPFGLKRIK
jgi:hypothetical protein